MPTVTSVKRHGHIRLVASEVSKRSTVVCTLSCNLNANSVDPAQPGRNLLSGILKLVGILHHRLVWDIEASLRAKI